MSNKRASVFNDTKNRTRNMAPGISYEVYFETEYKPKLENVESHAKIIVENSDTLVSLAAMITSGLKPLVLNMASEYKPGGGVCKGSMAQEEELFRRSNYWWSISDKPYPLVNKAVLTKDVIVIKDTDYGLLENTFVGDFIACPAIRRPNLSDDDKYSNYDRKDMRKRIFNIFEIGVLNKNDSLLLGAFGCGAFRNPPVEVAKLFKEAIEYYDGYFREIRFAVLDTKGEGNYEIFRDMVMGANIGANHD